MTLENNRAPLLYYIKLCASFQIHQWIQTEVTVRKRSIWVKTGNFLSCVTFKFDVWPWKTVGRLDTHMKLALYKYAIIIIISLFYSTSSFVHHFKAMDEFNLKLQSGNAQFGSKLAIFVPCDLEIWQMTLKNNRAPPLCCFKLRASFRTHWWIQTAVTVRKRPIWVKFDDF